MLQLFLRVLFGNFIVKTAKLVLNQKDHTLNFSLDLSGANVFQSIYFGGKLFIVSWSFVLLFEVICALLPSKTDTLLLMMKMYTLRSQPKRYQFSRGTDSALDAKSITLIRLASDASIVLC